MSNQRFFPALAPRDQTVTVTDAFVGAGAADATLPNLKNRTGFLTKMTRTGAGTFTVAFRYKYPELASFSSGHVGATTGLRVEFSALDLKAGTGTLVCTVGGTPTDPATTDTLYLTFHVRNSGVNK